MTAETAPGGPGRPELHCVGSPRGLSVHLLDPTSQTVLCNGIRNGKVRTGPALAPFALNGCGRCAAEAAERGYETVAGFDGEAVSLHGFRPFSAGS